MTETPPAAAADLNIGGPASPPSQQQAPAVMPPSGVPWRDDTGALHANLSPQQLATERAEYLKIFDSNARLARLRGEDMTGYSAADRIEWAQKFDAAAAQDGLSPTATPPQAELDRFERAMLPYAQPRPDEYTPRFSGPVRELPTERLEGVLNATRGLASELHLLPALGTSLLEHVQETAARLNGMTPDGRAAWLDQQEQLGVRMAGSEEKFIEAKERVRQLLSAAKSELARDLLNTSVPVLDSAWLAVTLGRHQRQLEAMRRRGK